MPDDINDRWREVCEQLAVEQNPDTFTRLLAEINLMLEQREAALKSGRKNTPRPESQADGSA